MWISESRIVNNGIDKDMSKRFQTSFFFFTSWLPYKTSLCQKKHQERFILITHLIILVNGMVIFDGHSHLDNL